MLKENDENNNNKLNYNSKKKNLKKNYHLNLAKQFIAQIFVFLANNQKYRGKLVQDGAIKVLKK